MGKGVSEIEFNEEMIEKYGWETSVLRAVRLKCVDDCCGGSRNEVKFCPVVQCKLWPFRLGKNPFRKKRQLTDEQRQAVADRLAKAREKKG